MEFSWDLGDGHTRYFQFTVLHFAFLVRLLFSRSWRPQGFPIDKFFDDGAGAGFLLEAAKSISFLVRFDQFARIWNLSREAQMEALA